MDISIFIWSFRLNTPTKLKPPKVNQLKQSEQTLLPNKAFNYSFIIGPSAGTFSSWISLISPCYLEILYTNQQEKDCTWLKWVQTISLFIQIL